MSFSYVNLHVICILPLIANNYITRDFLTEFWLFILFWNCRAFSWDFHLLGHESFAKCLHKPIGNFIRWIKSWLLIFVYWVFYLHKNKWINRLCLKNKSQICDKFLIVLSNQQNIIICISFLCPPNRQNQGLQVLLQHFPHSNDSILFAINVQLVC